MPHESKAGAPVAVGQGAYAGADARAAETTDITERVLPEAVRPGSHLPAIRRLKSLPATTDYGVLERHIVFDPRSNKVVVRGALVYCAIPKGNCPHISSSHIYNNGVGVCLCDGLMMALLDLHRKGKLDLEKTNIVALDNICSGYSR
jgi:hypothetical protein